LEVRPALVKFDVMIKVVLTSIPETRRFRVELTKSTFLLHRFPVLKYVVDVILIKCNLAHGL
jgi:hypothetical protein